MFAVVTATGSGASFWAAHWHTAAAPCTLSTVLSCTHSTFTRPWTTTSLSSVSTTPPCSQTVSRLLESLVPTTTWLTALLSHTLDGAESMYVYNFVFKNACFILLYARHHAIYLEIHFPLVRVLELLSNNFYTCKPVWPSPYLQSFKITKNPK